MGLFLSLVMAFTLSVGFVPPEIKLSGKEGGFVDGKPFSTQMIKGKVYLVLYVDPDVRKLNKNLIEILKKQNFDKEKFGSIVIINMKATWLPKFVLSKILKKKQKEFPDTIYVKDNNKVFVKKWGLKDDDYNVLIFDKDGKLIYKKSGKLSDEDINEIISLIKAHI
ncbi:MAG: transcriptional regulator [Aquificae bacterium]|nr:transcriptional regulator [Aquificota bacterium]